MALGKPSNDVEAIQESSVRARLLSVLKTAASKVITPPAVGAYDWEKYHDASYQGHPTASEIKFIPTDNGTADHYQNLA